jgi:competence protein ComEC
LNPALEGRDIEVVGRVQGLMQQAPEQVRFRLRVESAQLQGEPVALPPVLALAWYAPRGQGLVDPEDASESGRQPMALLPGDVWRMTVRLKSPHGQRNPHGFDHELSLWAQGVQAVGYVRNSLRDPLPKRLGAGGPSVDGLRHQAREAIFARVSDRQLAGVLAALVMGDQAAIDRADWDVFRATGVAHLMSISGLHITLFAWLAMRLLRAAWRMSARWTPALCLAAPAHQAGAWGGLALAAGYALFAGWGVPAQRTVAMLAVVVLLRHTGKHWPWPQVWLLAMAVVVAGEPWALMQPGFWLSFVAVGVLLASEQGLITLALAPRSVLLFHQISLVGLIANALAIPWVTWGITPLALLGLLFPPLWTVAAALLEGLMAVLRPMSAASHAVLEHAAAPWWCGIAALAGALLLVLRGPWYLRLLGLPLMLPLVLWQPLRPAHGEVEVLALDVGQGSAVLVRTASHSLLYDTGPRYSRESDAGHRVVVPALRALGERLDLVVLSHSDSDHIGGAPAVLASQPQARVLASFGPLPGQGALRWQACEAGMHWVWDGVRFEVLHPQPGDEARWRQPNGRSCVLQMQSAGTRPAAALLTGDLELAQEADLISRGTPLAADWLLVPHHGSRTSSSAAFLDAVRPSLAVVQAGYRNRFGHPVPDVMARYRERGVEVAATPACGATTWRSAAPRALECQRERGRRYWHHRAPPALAGPVIPAPQAAP